MITTTRYRVAVCATMPANTYSGGRYYALMLAEALAQGGHEVHFVINQMPVFYPDMALFPQHERIRVARTSDFRSGMPEGNFDFVILIPAASFSGYYHRVELFAIDRGARLVFVNFESGDWFNSLSPVPRPLSDWAPWRRAVEGASIILSISGEGNIWAEKFYASRPRHARFEFCYPPINTPAADRAVDIPRENRLLLFMRFSTARHKGSESIDELFCDAIRGCTMVFVLGKEDIPIHVLERLTSLAKKFNVKLEFKPRLSDVEKFIELKRARLVLFPSLFEGYGYPPVEALYCGTACVAFRLPVLEETCGDKLYYADHGDWPGFRRQIEAALADTPDRRALCEQVRAIAPLDTATAALEAAFARSLADGPIPADERARRRSLLAFQERWRLSDFKLRVRNKRHHLRRQLTSFGSRQSKRIKGRARSARRILGGVARKVAALRRRNPLVERSTAFMASSIKKIRTRRKSKRRVCYYPAFDTGADLTNHWYRAKWYLPYTEGLCEDVVFPAKHGTVPGPCPEYMCDTPAPKKHLRTCTPSGLALFRALMRSDVILVWKKGFESPLLDFLGPLCGIPVVNVATDDLASREYGVYCSLNWKQLKDPIDRGLLLAEHRQRFQALAKTLRSQKFDRACVFGTGPSLELAQNFEYGHSFNVVCNSIVQNDNLLDHIKPHFICAGDVVSHLGVSVYADKFRADLVRVLKSRDIYFLTTSDFGYLFLLHYPELADKVFLIEQTMKGPNYDLSLHYGAPRLDSTLNIHMLPLAATVADEIWLLGCDGKSEVRNNEDFWAHAKQAQYHDLVNTGHLCHPTFDVHRQASTYDRFISSTAASVEMGEKIHGKRYGALIPSNIPVLKARSIQPDALNAAGLTPPYPVEKLASLLPDPAPGTEPPAHANGRASLPVKAAISKCRFERPDVLVIVGWALAPAPVDRVEVWLADQLLGTANLRMHRKDIAAKFPEYGEVDSGFQFFGRTSGAQLAPAAARVRVYSSGSLLHEEILVPKQG